MWTIYTFGNGDVLTQILLGIRIMMTTGRFESLMELALLVFAMFGLVYFVFNRRFLVPLVVGAFFILFVSVRITVDVSVEDQVNPDVPDQIVNSVPLAIALPAYLSGQVGYYTTQLVEASFPMPVQYTQGQASFNRPLFDLQKVLNARLQDSDLARNTDSYFMMCVFREVGLLQKNLGTLMNSPNLLNDIGATNNALTALGYTGGTLEAAPRVCPDFYSSLILPAYTTGQPDYEGAMRHLRTQLQLDPATGDEEGLTEDIRANLLLSVGQSARDMINNVLLIHAWKNAESADAKRRAATADTVLLQQQAIQKDLKFQSYSKSYVAQKVVPLLRTIVEGVVYIMTPFLLVLAISPGMSRLMGTYWRLFMWLQTWSPLYAVLNFVMFWEARSRLGAILSSNGVGQSVNYATLDRINEHVAMLNSTAADYVWLVPAIGFGLMWGGSQVLGSILAGSRTAETVAGQVGGQFSRGLGANLEEGPSYRHEQRGAQFGEMIGHDVEPQMTVPTGQGGFRVDSQSGTSEIHDSQGGITSIGANGIQNYKGPEGQYSMDSKGHLLSGVFRHKMFDPQSGKQVDAQTSVFGSMVEHRFDTMGEDGSRKSVLVQENQDTGELVARTEQSVRKGLSETRTIAEDGSQSFARSGNVPLFLEIAGETRPDAGFVQMMGERGPGERVDTLTQSTFQSTMGAKQSYTGRLVERDGQFHFLATEGGAVRGFDNKDTEAGVHRESFVSPDGSNYFVETGQAEQMVLGKDGVTRPMEGYVRAFGSVDRSDPVHPRDIYSSYSLTSDEGGHTHTVTGTLGTDASGRQFLVEATEHFESGTSGVAHDTHTVGSYTLSGTFTALSHGEANQPGVPTAFFGSAIDNSKPGSPAFQANALLYDGQVSFFDGREGGTKSISGERNLVDGSHLSGQFTQLNVMGQDGHQVEMFHGYAQQPGAPARDVTGLIDNGSLVSFKGASGNEFRDVIERTDSGDLQSIGAQETYSAPGGTHSLSNFQGVTVNPQGDAFKRSSTNLDGVSVYSDQMRGSRQMTVEFEQSLRGYNNEVQSIDKESGWRRINDGHRDMDVYANLYYGPTSSETGERKLLGGTITNVTDNTYSTFMKDGEGNEVWGIARSLEDPNSGAMSGSIDQTVKVVAAKNGAIDTQVLGPMKDDGGQREVLYHSVLGGLDSQYYNNERKSGIFTVPDPMHPGQTKELQGTFYYSPQSGQLIASEVTDLQTGKIGQYRTDAQGQEHFQVVEYSQSPDGASVIANTKELSKNEYAAHGFAVNDVLDGSGNVLSSSGHKGSDFHDFNRVQFHHDSGANLTITQMAFAAKGTDISNPTQTDEAIAYGLEFGRIGMDGASRYLILKGRMGKFGGGGVGGTPVQPGGGPVPNGPGGGGGPSGLLDSHQNMGAWWKEYSGVMDNAISFARSSVEHLEKTGRAQSMSPEELQNFAANAAYNAVRTSALGMMGEEASSAFGTMPRWQEGQESLLKISKPSSPGVNTGSNK